ncbi:MAG: RdgB/HAM1 family non-canonical purine NTP pyrophosphatase [Opitutales bacterium]
MNGTPFITHLATGNAHKVAEMAALARAAAAQPGMPDLRIVRPERVPAVVEDTGTFIGNARKKARALREILPPDAWVLADDSGVCVDELGGAPGVESAYYAGPAHDMAANLRQLAEVMHDVPEGRRGACFYCVLLLAGPGGEMVFEGRCPGTLRREPAGGHGFGYDPLFVPDGHTRTYAELTDGEKNRISHRARAFTALATWLAQAVG